MRNSTTGRNPLWRRRMTSRVQPRICPCAPYTGSQDVTPWMVPSGSWARPTRTWGSSASSMPPRVKPISGSPLSPVHSRETARTCSTSAGDSSARVTRRKEMFSLAARFSAERTSCQDLPRNCSSGRSTMVSSATWTCCQPRLAAACTVGGVTENRAGTAPARSAIRANSATAAVRVAAGPTGSPTAIMTPACRWYATDELPSRVRKCELPGQVVIQDSVLPPLRCSSSVAVRWSMLFGRPLRSRRRAGTRKALRPAISTTSSPAQASRPATNSGTFSNVTGPSTATASRTRTSSPDATFRVPIPTAQRHADRRPRRRPCTSSPTTTTVTTTSVQDWSALAVEPSGPSPGSSQTTVEAAAIDTRPMTAASRHSRRPGLPATSGAEPRVSLPPTGSPTTTTTRCTRSASVPTQRNATATYRHSAARTRTRQGGRTTAETTASAARAPPDRPTSSWPATAAAHRHPVS